MNAESLFLDEISERLIVIYNKRRLVMSDIHQRTRENVRDMAEIADLDALATKYEALLAPSAEQGIPA